MAPPVVLLLLEARAAGVRVGLNERGGLTLRAKELAADLAVALRAREVQVLALYDWTRARMGEAQPCALCGKPALLRDPVDQRPCHKVCVGRLLSGKTVPRAWRVGRVA